MLGKGGISVSQTSIVSLEVSIFKTKLNENKSWFFV